MTCTECKGKCCVGDIEVSPHERIYSNPKLTVDKPNISHERYMIVDKNNQCICLVDGLCSIYPVRPEICKAFEYDSYCCKVFQCGKTFHKCNPCVFAIKGDQDDGR